MKILVVDDHVLIREALRGVLGELGIAGMAILEAADSRRALEALDRDGDVQMILLDLNLPDRDGLDLLAELGRRHPTMPVVVLSAYHDRERVTQALELGALGFIPKSSRREVMLSALRLVLAGGVYVPPEILGRRDPDPASAASEPATADRRALASQFALTARQVDVLALMMQGKSNKAIGRLLHLAEPTVKIHVSAILKALDARNRTEAVIAASAVPSTRGRGLG